MREGEFKAKNGARVIVRRARISSDDLSQKRLALNNLAQTLLSRASAQDVNLSIPIDK